MLYILKNKYYKMNIAIHLAKRNTLPISWDPVTDAKINLGKQWNPISTPKKQIN